MAVWRTGSGTELGRVFFGPIYFYLLNYVIIP